MLVVLDGWGHSDDPAFNAIHCAKTPVWDRIWSECPRTLLRCAGIHVGLPPNQMGNSEVGHMHIGSGRLIDQDLSRISSAIETGTFNQNKTLVEACQAASSGQRSIHILGLSSPGGVHCHEDHILALVDMANGQGVPRIYVHAFLDGRDTAPKSATQTLERIHRHCSEVGGARIASIVGRYYAMDRNKNWERIDPVHKLVLSGQAPFAAADPLAAIDLAYARGESDEFVKATVIHNPGEQHHKVEDGDVIIFANFRADRARQITLAITEPHFDFFQRMHKPVLGAFITMTNYGEQFDLPVAFQPLDLADTFGAVIENHGLRQLRIAETEKYAHVTFFFNGGEERIFDGEDRVLIPSPNVATYDLRPEMSAVQVSEAATSALGRREYDAIICNFANADMVGHTGNFEATVKSIEVLDNCIGRIVDAAKTNEVELLITADHGNAERMRSPTTSEDVGNAHTAHTNNLVPLVFVGRKAKIAAKGNLSDIAPTMLSLMSIPIPGSMTGTPLLSPVDSRQDAA